MPTYEYRCKDCGQSLEVVQAFTEDPLRECPACTGRLRKVFGNVGISFKGNGFYRTDSRSPAKGDGKGDGKGDAATKDGAKDGTAKKDSEGASTGSKKEASGSSSNSGSSSEGKSTSSSSESKAKSA